jgi:hypothetical protein
MEETVFKQPLLFKGNQNPVTAVCVKMKAGSAPDVCVMTSCSAPPLYAQFRWTTRFNAEFESGFQIQGRLKFLC